MPVCPAGLTHVYTPSTWGFDYFWSSAFEHNYFTFDVMACHDANIALSALHGVTSTLAYQVGREILNLKKKSVTYQVGREIFKT